MLKNRGFFVKRVFGPWYFFCKTSRQGPCEFEGSGWEKVAFLVAFWWAVRRTECTECVVRRGKHETVLGNQGMYGVYGMCGIPFLTLHIIVQRFLRCSIDSKMFIDHRDRHLPLIYFDLRISCIC